MLLLLNYQIRLDISGELSASRHMKYQALFSPSMKENVTKFVVCGNDDWHFKGSMYSLRLRQKNLTFKIRITVISTYPKG